MLLYSLLCPKSIGFHYFHEIRCFFPSCPARKASISHVFVFLDAFIFFTQSKKHRVSLLSRNSMLFSFLPDQKSINFSCFCVSRCFYILYSAQKASGFITFTKFDAFFLLARPEKHLFPGFLEFSMLLLSLLRQKSIYFSDFCVSRCVYILYSAQKASGFIIFVSFDAFYPINGFGRYSIRNIRF